MTKKSIFSLFSKKYIMQGNFVLLNYTRLVMQEISASDKAKALNREGKDAFG
ncbi:MAG: hypothetical protein IJJ33_05535 [Victivallales bacterium]|nr:hypothetical protein [Victivallales bacterium]